MTLSKTGYGEYSFRDLTILILIFVLPFFHKFSNFTIGLLFTLALVEIFRTKDFPKIRFFWFLPVLFLYYMISEMFLGGMWFAFEKKLLLLLVPVCIALNSDFNRQKLWNKISLSFILGNLLVIIICTIRAFIRSFTFMNGRWEFTPKVIPGNVHDFLTSSVMGGNFFFAEEFSYFLHPTYFGIYISFAQYLIYGIIKTPDNKKLKGFLLGCYFIFLLALFLLSSKAAIITSLMLSFFIISRVQMKLPVRIATVGAFIIVSSLFIYFNPKLKIFRDTFQTTQFIDPDPNTRTSHDLRILSWNASLEIIKNNWLFGVGEANKTTALLNVYRVKGYIVPAAELHNSHNQYLDFLIGGGIVGLALFLAGLIHLFWRSIKESNFPLLALLLIFSFNCLFENVLSRHWGILFFSVFISLLTAKRQNLS